MEKLANIFLEQKKKKKGVRNGGEMERLMGVESGTTKARKTKKKKQEKGKRRPNEHEG